MARIARVQASLTDARDIRTVWEAIPDLKVGSISLTDLITIEDEANQLQAEYRRKDAELTGVKNNRDDKLLQLSEIVSRFRSIVRGVYGPDSTLYGQAGGTRTRDRRPRRARAKVASG